MNPAALAEILRQLPDDVLLERALLSHEQRARMIRALDDEELVLVVVGQIDGVRPRPRPSQPRQRPPRTHAPVGAEETAEVLACVAASAVPISIANVVVATGVKRARAQRALAALVEAGKLTVSGRRRGTRYAAANGVSHVEPPASA